MRLTFQSLLIFSLLVLNSAQAGSLIISFNNITEAKGQLMVFLGNEKGEYVNGYQIPIKKQGDLKHEISGLADGKYTIKVFHDLNSDEKLNTNMVGMPKEPYGFSNNARGSFGPPSIEDQVFSVKGETKITISLE